MQIPYKSFGKNQPSIQAVRSMKNKAWSFTLVATLGLSVLSTAPASAMDQTNSGTEQAQETSPAVPISKLDQTGMASVDTTKELTGESISPPTAAPASSAALEAPPVKAGTGTERPTGHGLAMGSAGKNVALNKNDLEKAQAFSRTMPGSQQIVSPLAAQPGGTAGMQLGMDVSGWQGTVDWNQAWASGARFAYVKASEGAWTLNDYFAQQYNGAAQVGMIRGAYHFARPNISSGASQAQVFIESGGGWSGDGITLPGVLDLEAHAPTSGSDPVGKCYNMSPAQLVSWTGDFLATYKRVSARDAVIYTSHDFWLTCMGNSTAFAAATPLWIAAYGPSLPNLLIPGGWPGFTFWQYADSGTFVGDQNVFNGSMEQLRSFARGSQTVVPAVTQEILSGHDFDGDKNPDVIATKSDGTLWFYKGSGVGTIGAARKIGSGWGVFDQVVSVGDLNGDGKADLMARNRDGSLWFYAGTGKVDTSSEGYRPGVKVGDFGWNAFTQILGVGDFNQDGKRDLLAKGNDGSLWLKPGLGSGAVGQGRQIGWGWQIFDQLVAPGDYDLDGKVDVIARKSDGSLWFYAGVGVVDGNNEGYKGGVKIGEFGWSNFSQIVGAGDVNNDGKNDLLARELNGNLLLYPGTGMKDNGYAQAMRIGAI